MKLGSTWERKASCIGCMVWPQRDAVAEQVDHLVGLAGRCSDRRTGSTRTWQRSATAWTRTPEVSVARIWKTTVGPAA